MSRKPPPLPEPSVPEEERAVAALRVSEDFMALSPQEQREFVDETLTTLVNMPKKKLAKFFSKLFFKKGKPTAKQLETANQLIVTFLFSVKEEFRYHYATMVLKNMPNAEIPEDLPRKLEQIRQLTPLHFMVSDEVGSALYNEWNAQGCPHYDMFFSNLLNGKVMSLAPKPQSGKPAAKS